MNETTSNTPHLQGGNGLLPYPVIVSAVSGNVDAMNTVLTNSTTLDGLPGMDFTMEHRITETINPLHTPAASETAGLICAVASTSISQRPSEKVSGSFGINASPDSGTVGASSSAALTGIARNKITSIISSIFMFHRESYLSIQSNW